MLVSVDIQDLVDISKEIDWVEQFLSTRNTFGDSAIKLSLAQTQRKLLHMIEVSEQPECNLFGSKNVQ